jgi:hypothetical protein
MTNSSHNRLFCAALLLSSLQFGLSQTITNSFFFGPPLTPVWDISGIYQITNHMQSAKLAPLDIVFNALTMGVDSRGKLQGGGTILVPVGDDTLAGDYRLTGSITGGGTQTRVNFSVHFKANGVVAGVLTTCNISAKYNLVVTNLTTLAGTSSGSAHFSNLGSGSLKSSISLPLPPGVDGGWNVTLDMFPFAFGTKLAGTAVVLVDNIPSTTLATKATGTLPAQSATAKVKLSGTGFSAGTQINMQFIPIVGATNVATINGKILGQKVKN